jgi:hypothetical protein
MATVQGAPTRRVPTVAVAGTGAEAGPVTLAAAGTVIAAAAATGTVAVATGATPTAANPLRRPRPRPRRGPVGGAADGSTADSMRETTLVPPFAPSPFPVTRAVPLHRHGGTRPGEARGFLSVVWRESFVIMESSRPIVTRMAVHLRRYLCDHGPCPAGVPGMFRAPPWFA